MLSPLLNASRLVSIGWMLLEYYTQHSTYISDTSRTHNTPALNELIIASMAVYVTRTTLRTTLPISFLYNGYQICLLPENGLLFIFSLILSSSSLLPWRPFSHIQTPVHLRHFCSPSRTHRSLHVITHAHSLDIHPVTLRFFYMIRP